MCDCISGSHPNHAGQWLLNTLSQSLRVFPDIEEPLLTDILYSGHLVYMDIWLQS